MTRRSGRVSIRVMSGADAGPDPRALLRSSAYVKLLVLAALVGVPVSAAAYGFLELVDLLQHQLFDALPSTLGFDHPPVWWPAPLVTVGGIATGAAIRFLPGPGGHSPADGLKTGGGPLPVDQLPGVLLAALATLAFGVVLGPEAPLIAMGSGLGALAVQLAAGDANDQGKAVIAAAGSFAAIASLLGSPLLGAFLLLEASGLGGPMLGLVLMPGLLAAGIGSLIFLGLDSLTGLGTLSLAVPGLAPIGPPTVAMFGWAIAIGVAAPIAGLGIRRIAFAIRPHAERRMLTVMPLLGLAIAGLAIGFEQVTDKASSEVLFSGQSALGGLIADAGTWSVGALLALLVAKGIAYGLSLSAFRGGPVFPSMFLGAAGGIALSHLPGLDLIPAAAMGIGAMCAVMLSLPLTSVLLATLLLGKDGTAAMPLVIVAVAVAYVVNARLQPEPEPEPVHPHRVMTHDPPPGDGSPTTAQPEKADV
jgi:H+/Cl- antiporter ClcA